MQQHCAAAATDSLLPGQSSGLAVTTSLSTILYEFTCLRHVVPSRHDKQDYHATEGQASAAMMQMLILHATQQH